VPGLRTAKLDIAVKAAGPNRSTVAITYVHTGLTESGNRYIAESIDEAHFTEAMVDWEAAMNHYLRTGTMLKRAR
jgi:hypothetical protein